MGYITDGRLVENFSLEEMTNKQADDEVKLVITPEVVKHACMMQELRDYYGKPLNVNSWYRTESFNKKVGGDLNSCHLDGIATDISLPKLTEAKRTELITAWKVICSRWNVIGGVSLYKWGIHFDSNNNPARYGKVNPNFRATDFR